MKQTTRTAIFIGMRMITCVLVVALSAGWVDAAESALVRDAASGAGRAGVRFGIDVLEDDGFKQLAGKRVGLVANPAAVDAQLRATSDVLANAKEVKLVCLFGP